MTREIFDPLDLELRRMLRDLSDGPPAPREARARLRNALLLGGGPPPDGSPSAEPALPSANAPGPLPHAGISARIAKTAANAGWMWTVGGVGAAGLIGAWLAVGARGPVSNDLSVHPKALPQTIAAPGAEAAPLVAPGPTDRGAEQAQGLAPAPAAQSAKPEKKAVDSSLAAERKLLDAARAALVAGDSSTGLERLARHAAQFPRGALAEERAALTVDALVAAGRYDEAKRRAEAFRARYPGSIFAPSVEAALKAIP